MLCHCTCCIGWTRSRVGIFEEEEGVSDGLPLVASALPPRRRRGHHPVSAGVPGAEHGQRHAGAAEWRAQVDLGIVPLDGGELGARDGGRQRVQLREQGMAFSIFTEMRITFFISKKVTESASKFIFDFSLR